MRQKTAIRLYVSMQSEAWKFPMRDQMEFKLPGRQTEKYPLKSAHVPTLLWDFMEHFDVQTAEEKPVKTAQSLFGYTTYDAVRFFDRIQLEEKINPPLIPLMRYRLYQYVIAINHFKDELYICENHVEGIGSDLALVESLIRSKMCLFFLLGEWAETSNMEDEDYRQMVEKGIKSCLRGDVFQIVLSRRFQWDLPAMNSMYTVHCRNVNPSPYLFYFDYGDYRLMGSSPESQILIKERESNCASHCRNLQTYRKR